MGKFQIWVVFLKPKNGFKKAFFDRNATKQIFNYWQKVKGILFNILE